MTDSTSITIGKLTICAVTVQGVKRYELWHADRPKAIGRFDSFPEARDAARRYSLSNGEGND